MYKDTNCADLDKNRIGESVTVAGWVSRRRDHGNLIFIDLRDRSGLVQVVFNPKISKSSHNLSEKLRNDIGDIDGVKKTETFVSLQVVKREME